MNHFILKITMLFFLLLGFACSSKHKNISVSAQSETLDNNLAINDTIAFLLFNIRYTDKSKMNTSLTLKSITKNAGKIKSNNTNADFQDNRLVFSFYNKNKIIDSLLLEHPLNKHVEFIDENNQFIAKKLQLDSTEFFIRIQLKEDYKFLKITQFVDNKKSELLMLQLK
jgi:hypothetical protein